MVQPQITEERQRILLVSTSYPKNAEDWRGRFIADMATALAHRHDLKLNIWAPPGDLPDDVDAASTPSETAWLDQLSDRGGIAAQLRGGGLGAAKSALMLMAHLSRLYRREDCDVAHVNWLQNALPLWGTKTPLLVTVLGSDFGLLRLPGMQAMLRAVFRQRPTIIAPNANWMRTSLETMFGDVARVRPVPFGVDRRWFEVNRQQAEPRLWLAVTRITHNKIGDLFDWGEGLFGGERQLHLFGPMQEPMPLPSWAIWHGPTNPTSLRDDWFPRATGLITLSRHDEGRPQIMLEAMAAGLPVIASSLPAHRDFIQQEETGWLIGERAALKLALHGLEERGTNRRIGEAARSWIKQSIGDWDDCAGRYRTLYGELLAS
ncbi:MAG: glycosyltransferase family 4 protein [Gallionellaceae bacterium]|nr:glycosyltransferase family 4 protein [Gallionellaceae bacterium]